MTQWIGRLQAGEDGSVQQNLWNRYFEQLVRVARARFAGARRGAEDEEDAVLSAFHSFFDRVKEGRFPQLRDRTDLWPLLVTITVRKSLNLRRKARAGKRDEQRIATSDGEEFAWLAHIADDGPTPDLAAQAAEEAARLMSLLENESLQIVARKKLEGFTNREIADAVGITERSVERRLLLIRQTWSEATSGA